MLRVALSTAAVLCPASVAFGAELHALTGEFRVENTPADMERCAAGDARPLRFVFPLRFEAPFAEPPRMILSLTDVDPENVSRLRITAENVTREGVTIVVTAGCSASAWTAGGSFMAVGAR